MNCPKCNSENIKVRDTRQTAQGNTRRYRECEDCGHRFKTIKYAVINAKARAANIRWKERRETTCK